MQCERKKICRKLTVRAKNLSRLKQKRKSKTKNWLKFKESAGSLNLILIFLYRHFSHKSSASEN